MAGLADTLKGLDKHDDAVQLMTEDERLFPGIVGADHRYTLHMAAQLKEWNGTKNTLSSQTRME
jgi:hypothetical protein